MPGQTWQITSEDSGQTWLPRTSLDDALGRFAGLYPGPANAGIMLTKGSHKGRLLFGGWSVPLNVQHPYPADDNNYCVSYWSDTHGKTFATPTAAAAVGDSDVQPHAKGIVAEPSLVELSNGSVLMSMRVNAPGGPCDDCRASAISTDSGSSWSQPWFVHLEGISAGNDQGGMLRGAEPADPTKPAPIFFSTRVNWKGTKGETAVVLTSFDDGASFPQELAVPVFVGAVKYSGLSHLPGDAPGGINRTHVAMLYERGPPDAYAHVGVAIVPVPTSPSLKSDDHHDVPAVWSAVKNDTS